MKLFLFSEGGKKKSVEQLSANLPAGTGVLLVGKTVDHQITDKVYRGRVFSVVPEFSTWYNIKYKKMTRQYMCISFRKITKMVS